MIFDSHAHLDDEAFDIDRKQVIEYIKNEGISYIIDPASDISSSRKSVELSKKYDFIYSAVGIHPHEAKYMDDTAMKELKNLCKNEKTVAIGEIGLDYYYDYSPRQTQKEVFEQQIYLAKEMDLPFIIHSRDAASDTLDMLKSCKKDTPCVLHCFSQSLEMAKEYLKLGCYLSFAGPLTFKKSKNLQEVVAYAPLDMIFIETDSPYLTPEPKRGKRNDPSNVKFVGKKLAELKNMPEEEIFEITAKNALKFFKIS
ncbi:TatD family deoxyribonuclease [Criibacterium bergeronii]|uniref:TatD family deoxyribonuclease n=1 Tax=Criibacterium bergeronii TaxID=1871336 RepID=A0A552V8L8_9FIRM|nr:TatD family hydrolase [Criibacterium bergeronii]TRW26800.1 TatD family deoxyribonuclease [Criibacterium bergeronii]